MFLLWMVKEKELGFAKRFLIPSIATIACGFTVFAAVYAHGIIPYRTAKEAGEFSFPVLFYLIVFTVFMIIAFFFSPFVQSRSKKFVPTHPEQKKRMKQMKKK